MNLRRTGKPRAHGVSEETEADVRRVEALWADCRKRFGADGPFLFGRFTAADAMYAPVVTRLASYAISVSDGAHAYMQAVQDLDAFREWKTAALAEPWTIPHDEVD